MNPEITSPVKHGTHTSIPLNFEFEFEFESESESFINMLRYQYQHFSHFHDFLKSESIYALLLPFVFLLFNTAS